METNNLPSLVSIPYAFGICTGSTDGVAVHEAVVCNTRAATRGSRALVSKGTLSESMEGYRHARHSHVKGKSGKNTRPFEMQSLLAKLALSSWISKSHEQIHL